MIMPRDLRDQLHPHKTKMFVVDWSPLIEKLPYRPLYMSGERGAFK